MILTVEQLQALAQWTDPTGRPIFPSPLLLAPGRYQGEDLIEVTQGQRQCRIWRDGSLADRP